METAKVDIRKLQLLNDRINQCIDALSQVRLSVHGLTTAANPSWGIGAGYGQTPVGLSHTSAFGQPFISPGIGGMVNPAIQPTFGASPFGQVPVAPNPLFQTLAPGLSHSGYVPAAFTQGMNPYAGLSPFGGEGLDAYSRTGVVDPLLTLRIAQTFPYAQFPAPPVISIY